MPRSKQKVSPLINSTINESFHRKLCILPSGQKNTTPLLTSRKTNYLLIEESPTWKNAISRPFVKLDLEILDQANEHTSHVCVFLSLILYHAPGADKKYYYRFLKSRFQNFMTIKKCFDEIAEIIFMGRKESFILDEYKLIRPNEVCAAINESGPCIITFPVNNNAILANNPQIWGTETNAGYGHCMLIIGYDLAEENFILQNSWGTNWGDNGLISLSFFDAKKYAWEIYSVKNKKITERKQKKRSKRCVIS